MYSWLHFGRRWAHAVTWCAGIAIFIDVAVCLKCIFSTFKRYELLSIGLKEGSRDHHAVCVCVCVCVCPIFQFLTTFLRSEEVLPLCRWGHYVPPEPWHLPTRMHWTSSPPPERQISYIYMKLWNRHVRKCVGSGFFRRYNLAQHNPILAKNVFRWRTVFTVHVVLSVDEVVL
jgi:hypothetical protein